jgi:hypothetical protein
MSKSQNILPGISKMVSAQHFGTEAGKWRSQA